MSSRYIIGIDLGTTNIAVSYIDTESDEGPRIFEVEQVSALGETRKQSTLPSFIYLPDPPDIAANALDISWAQKRDFSVGALARKNASSVPGKTISSSKSVAVNVREEPLISSKILLKIGNVLLRSTAPDTNKSGFNNNSLFNENFI